MDTLRIIPARAGFTLRVRRRQERLGDHPRSRGVYSCASRISPRTPGSSPLARGLLPAVNTAPNPLRIIPARAGFTTPTRSRSSRATDHPRSRGVYLNASVIAAHARGSSPLARGLHDAMTEEQKRAGIIPARAGFTASSRPSRATPRDHPRSRGVYWWAGAPPVSGRGSSPLARGLPEVEAAWERIVGIIPARAGFTRGAVHRGGRDRDHPRSRGVYEADSDDKRDIGGSSPLARGLLCEPGVDLRALRIIPARAGFT